MAESVSPLVIVPGVQPEWINELVLYDEKEEECGNVVRLEDNEWQCTFDTELFVTTATVATYQQAIDFLWRKCNEYLAGKGYVIAHIEMRIDNEQSRGT